MRPGNGPDFQLKARGLLQEVVPEKCKATGRHPEKLKGGGRGGEGRQGPLTSVVPLATFS